MFTKTEKTTRFQSFFYENSFSLILPQFLSLLEGSYSKKHFDLLFVTSGVRSQFFVSDLLVVVLFVHMCMPVISLPGFHLHGISFSTSSCLAYGSANS